MKIKNLIDQLLGLLVRSAASSFAREERPFGHKQISLTTACSARLVLWQRQAGEQSQRRAVKPFRLE